MVVLKSDPWASDHGAGVEVEFAAEETPVVDATVETTDWSVPIAPIAPHAAGPVYFVDGVRRADLRVLAEDAGRRAWGVAGTFAVGAVRAAEGRSTFDAWSVERLLIVNGGIAVPDVRVRIGAQDLVYRSRAIGGSDPDGPMQALQTAMREAEFRLATTLVGSGLVIADGPLHHTFGQGARVVGVAKRMVMSYLDPDRERLLAVLEPGQRTPLFAFGRELDRFAWYERLVPRAPAWHDLAGLVRCEVRAEVGASETQVLADAMAHLLPRYASRPGFDPRAPQNLTPVGALESRLRSLMGDPRLVRRALDARLARAAAPAEPAEAAMMPTQGGARS